MRVYNLSKKDLHYRNQIIPANGGFREYPSMSYVPTRDMKLQDTKVLAFGQLPSWWQFEQEARAAAEAKKHAEAQKADEAMKVAKVEKAPAPIEITKFEEAPEEKPVSKRKG